MQRIILQICFSIICFQEVCCSVSRRNLLPFSNLRRQTEPFPEQRVFLKSLMNISSVTITPNL